MYPAGVIVHPGAPEHDEPSVPADAERSRMKGHRRFWLVVSAVVSVAALAVPAASACPAEWARAPAFVRGDVASVHELG